MVVVGLAVDVLLQFVFTASPTARLLWMRQRDNHVTQFCHVLPRVHGHERGLGKR